MARARLSGTWPHSIMFGPFQEQMLFLAKIHGLSRFMVLWFCHSACCFAQNKMFAGEKLQRFGSRAWPQHLKLTVNLSFLKTMYLVNSTRRSTHTPKRQRCQLQPGKWKQNADRPRGVFGDAGCKQCAVTLVKRWYVSHPKSIWTYTCGWGALCTYVHGSCCQSCGRQTSAMENQTKVPPLSSFDFGWQTLTTQSTLVEHMARRRPGEADYEDQGNGSQKHSHRQCDQAVATWSQAEAAKCFGTLGAQKVKKHLRFRRPVQPFHTHTHR